MAIGDVEVSGGDRARLRLEDHAHLAILLQNGNLHVMDVRHVAQAQFGKQVVQVQAGLLHHVVQDLAVLHQDQRLLLHDPAQLGVLDGQIGPPACILRGKASPFC